MDASRWHGFNFQWLFDHDTPPRGPDREALDFLVGHGFTFVRLPMNYRLWTTGTAYTSPDEAVLALVDDAVDACRQRGLHLSLNLHRAPGYCITRAEIEPHNLWTDGEAQDGFVGLWALLAGRYADVPADELSFDLLNEPPAIGLRGFDRAVHERIMRRTVDAVRAVDPDRPIVLDGIDGGNVAIPELADVGAVHSTRGYQPYPVSHWGAEWWDGWNQGDGPRYPGVSYEGRTWGRAEVEAVYDPWREVEAGGVAVHVGEFGCYDRTPNADALRWLADLVDLYHRFGWGYALWNFEGPFGIIGHRRPGARLERRDGYLVDVDLLDILTGR